MIVTIIGSCANQIANREGVSILVEQGNENVLIDAGPGIVAALGRAGRNASDITNIILTHVHGDHITGFPYFVWNRNFERMGKTPASDLNVYGQEDVIEYAMFSLQHAYPELTFPFKVHFHTIREDETIELGCDMKVITTPAVHAVPCISCVIHSGDKKVVYSSDTLLSEKLVYLSMETDMLIHEGMMPNEMRELAAKVKHSLASDAGVFAKRVNAKQLALVHIAPGMIGHESVLLSEARERYFGPISIPHDGSVYIV